MKLFKSYLFVLTFVSTLGYAQDQRPVYAAYASKKFLSEIEVYAGPSMCSLRGNDGVNNTFQNERKIKIGYCFGIGVAHPLNSNLDVGIKLLYERKGGNSLATTTYFDERDQSFKTGKYKNIYNYNYYTSSIILNYVFGKKKPFRIGVGAFVALLDKQTLKQISLFNASRVVSTDTKYNTKFDSGFSTGFSYKITVNQKISLRLQLLHNLGLKNIRPMITNGQTMKTNNTSFLLGILLNQNNKP